MEERNSARATNAAEPKRRAASATGRGRRAAAAKAMASAGPAKHPHADAKYQICRREAMGYAVEVAIPGMNPTMVSGFITEQQAASWIAKHRQRVASGPLRLRRPSIPPPAVEEG